ncbi:hypothetical protein MNBD_GAMMA12-210 [hydrothermal vent metagenome]|uniref:Uncharacterized protein n=1 Tax=hydrothermal vent metagenome TaxID=652676 RepID=A0A3B0YCH1_9ZZZZ
MNRFTKSLLIIALLFSGSIAVHANKLPENVFKKYTISANSSPALHKIVREAAQSTHKSPRKARLLILKVFEKLHNGASIDKYDYLWTQYSLLKSSYETNSGNFGPGTKADFIKIAKNVLAYLKTQNVGEWKFTELGGFQMEVYRFAGNGLAWNLMDENNVSQKILQNALTLVIETERFIRGKQDFYIKDTKVRILLKLKRKNEAYKIVKTILAKIPTFADFQDFKKNKEYQEWNKTQ